MAETSYVKRNSRLRPRDLVGTGSGVAVPGSSRTEAPPCRNQRSRLPAATRRSVATARSGHVELVGTVPDVAAPWSSSPEAAPDGSQRSRPPAETGWRNATAHSDHALRQVTSPFVPSPLSARMAAPQAMRSRHSSPVRCSPAAALRCGLRGVLDRARVSATPASRLRVHGNIPGAIRAALLQLGSTEQPPRGACSCPAPAPRPPRLR